MKQSHYQAVVIGGGIVGASVLYHLTKLGWGDILLIERSELTAGSTWHAAADFHTLNGDPNVAALQKYTIDLYSELEAESGQGLGLHITGGVNIAATEDRWDWLQSNWAMNQTIGNDELRLVTPEEVRELVPVVSIDGVYGGMYNPNEGHIDASGITGAFVASAKQRGADVVLHNRVVELNRRPRGGWEVVTEHGTVTTDNVVDAAGLWARRVGRMAGVDLPVTPLQHHYLVTETIPEIATLDRELPVTVDLDGFTYARQEGQGLLVGLYELNPKHWQVEGAPWDFPMRLLEPEIDRISPELAIGMARFPVLEDVGVKTWVNGPFTFTPDGNPIVGPVPGVPGFWVACGVMAGFSQGGGVGLSLAQWMVDGEPAADVFGMDVARYGDFASADGYLRAATRQFYQRRFQMTYPNEQLPAGRPLKTSPIHDDLVGEGCQFMVNWGLEEPRYFVPGDPDFTEHPTLRRSSSHDIVGAEVSAARTGVALLDITGFSRYRVSGPGAREWLETLLAGRVPAPGRMGLTPMLSPSGRLMGDLTATCWGEEDFWLIGSYYLRAWHLRWFADHLPAPGVTVADLSDNVTGVAVVGPGSRDLLKAVAEDPAALDRLRWLRTDTIDVGLTRARVARVSVTGELGYELNVPAESQRVLYRTLREVGGSSPLSSPLGYDAVDVMRIEKSFGTWSREFTWSYTPGMSGLDRFIDFDRPGFIGRDAALAEREAGSDQVLVSLRVDSADDETGADAGHLDPIWDGERRVGFVTSGCFAHTLGFSMALAYVDRPYAEPGTALEVHVVGRLTKCAVIADSPHDPDGLRPRATSTDRSN